MFGGIETTKTTAPPSVDAEYPIDDDRLFDSWHEEQDSDSHLISTPAKVAGMSRIKSSFDFSFASSTSSESACGESERELDAQNFGIDVREYTHGCDSTPKFDSGLRKVMSPYVRSARLRRERARKPNNTTAVDASIASSIGVPYVALRTERPFLFDVHSYPLHSSLAAALQVDDLSQLHHHMINTTVDKLWEPLRDPERRIDFHRIYDSFVTSFCIPLLHAVAISKRMIHASSLSSNCVTYRYQVFPTITVVHPGSQAVLPSCDLATGHSIGCLAFHIPLTPSYGTNSLYVESYPGREDWHPLTAKSVGLGYVYDGSRCLSFSLENTTNVTRVSLDFRLMIFSERRGDVVDDELLCTAEQLDDLYCHQPRHDDFSETAYYDEAVIDLRLSACQGFDVVSKKNGSCVLLQPDPRIEVPRLC